MTSKCENAKTVELSQKLEARITTFIYQDYVHILGITENINHITNRELGEIINFRIEYPINVVERDNMKAHFKIHYPSHPTLKDQIFQ